MENKRYWENQYSKNNHIWGEEHSLSAEKALILFNQYNLENILIPGVGYGRNSRYFSDNGKKVTGIELSEKACELAKSYDPSTKVLNGSFLAFDFTKSRFEVVYCFDVLHLFFESNRNNFLAKCNDALLPDGYLFFTVLSDQDDYFGQGKEIEKNTFETKPGKIVHFFSQSDLEKSFKSHRIIEIGQLEDRVFHNEHGEKKYKIRYIFAMK